MLPNSRWGFSADITDIVVVAHTSSRIRGLLYRGIPTGDANGRFEASSPIRCVLSHRLQSVESRCDAVAVGRTYL